MKKNNLQRFVNLIYHYSSYLKLNLINIISYFICFCLVGFTVYDLCWFDRLGSKIFSLLLSFVFSYFVLSKIKLSNNLFIRIIQQFVIFTIGYAVIIYLFPF